MKIKRTTATLFFGFFCLATLYCAAVTLHHGWILFRNLTDTSASTAQTEITTTSKIEFAPDGKTVPRIQTLHNTLRTTAVENTHMLQLNIATVFLNALAMTMLFELMRRLFRNISTGNSFTIKTIQQMYAVSGVILVTSLLMETMQLWSEHLWNKQYIAGSANPANVLTSVKGVLLNFPVFSPLFCTGLAVLALSEVFRQGLILKRENDLTV